MLSSLMFYEPGFWTLPSYNECRIGTAGYCHVSHDVTEFTITNECPWGCTMVGSLDCRGKGLGFKPQARTKHALMHLVDSTRNKYIGCKLDGGKGGENWPPPSLAEAKDTWRAEGANISPFSTKHGSYLFSKWNIWIHAICILLSGTLNTFDCNNSVINPAAP